MVTLVYSLNYLGLKETFCIYEQTYFAKQIILIQSFSRCRVFSPGKHVKVEIKFSQNTQNNTL